ncbi:MAG: CBS domain-containing protein, partial [Chloroflexi bacterium]|nr:CBS domain-containing protein [Chloroflexota bacterium]
AVSVVAAQRLHPESVATMVLARRGIRLPSGLTQNPMDAVRVAEAMTRDFSTVQPDLSLRDLAARFSRTGYHGFPVVDRQGRLAGIVTLSDLENAVLQGTPSTDTTLRVADIMTTDLIAAHPDETLHQVLSRAGAAHVGRIPVVERGGPRRLVGVLRRTDIISAYAQALPRMPLPAGLGELRIGSLASTRLLEIELAPASELAGRRVRDLRLPPDTVLVAIRRNQQILIPRGDTVLAAGDIVAAITFPQHEATLRRYLAGDLLGR